MTTTNGIDAQKAQRWMGEVLRVHDDLDEQRMDNMNRCRIIRERLPVLFEAAKNEGLPLRAFKASVKKALLDRGIERLNGKIEDLKPEDADDAEAFEMLQQALGGFGDTPLGAATLDAATEKKAAAAARKAAKGAAATGSENQAETSTDAQVAANTALLQGENGIKPLPESDAEFDDATAKKPSRRQQKAAKLDEVTTH